MKENTNDLFDKDEINAEEIKELLTEGSSFLEGEDVSGEDASYEEIEDHDNYEESIAKEDSINDFIENSVNIEKLYENKEIEQIDNHLENIDENIDESAEESKKNNEEDDESEEIDSELEEILDRIKKRKKDRIEKNRKKRNIFIIIGIVITLFILSFTRLVNVDRIVVKGNSYFLDSEVISMAHVKMGNNLIYKPGKIKIKSYLLQNPYIEKVKVRRRLPSTLVIKIREREQMAAIPYDGNYIVTDSDRIVLRRTTDMPHLTVIEGVKIKKMKLAEKLEGENKKHLDDSYEILNLMKEHKLFFKKIIVDGDKTTIYIYDNLVCTGMTTDVKKMIEKNRMQEILKTLIDKGVKRGRLVVSENGYATYIPTFN